MIIIIVTSSNLKEETNKTQLKPTRSVPTKKEANNIAKRTNSSKKIIIEMLIRPRAVRNSISSDLTKMRKPEMLVNVKAKQISKIKINLKWRRVKLI